MAIVQRVSVEGFKSIRAGAIELDRLNVMIGVNGSGKTNLLSFFTLLNFSMTRSLQLFVQERCGGGSSLLFGGSGLTLQIRSAIEFRASGGVNTYRIALTHGAGDSLIYTDEEVQFKRDGFDGAPEVHSLGGGHRESVLSQGGFLPPAVHLVRTFLWESRSFQFHDTSVRSFVRQNCRADDERSLLSDGGNLAAVLHRLAKDHPHKFARIEYALQQALPWFEGFEIQTFGVDNAFVRLGWREKKPLSTFAAHQASDGTLRLMALLTLLNQPEPELPSLIVIDEPELGLHPMAIELLADEMKAASETSQLLVSTQSMQLLDAIGVDPIVVDRDEEGASAFSRPNPFSLDEWLDQYSVGSRWESR